MNEKSTIHTHQEQVDKAYVTTEKVRNRFSLRKKTYSHLWYFNRSCGNNRNCFRCCHCTKGSNRKN